MLMQTIYGDQEVKNPTDARTLAHDLNLDGFKLTHTNIRGKQVDTHVRKAGNGWEFLGGFGDWKPFTVK